MNSATALSLIGEVYIGSRALLHINVIWFDYIARLSQRGAVGDILLVQMISTFLRCAYRKGGGQHPVANSCFLSVYNKTTSIVGIHRTLHKEPT